MSFLTVALVSALALLGLAADTTVTNTETSYAYTSDLVVETGTVYDYTELSVLDSTKDIIVRGELLIESPAGLTVTANSFQFQNGSGHFHASGDLKLTNMNSFQVSVGGLWNISASGNIEFLSPQQSNNSGELQLRSDLAGTFNLGTLTNTGLISIDSQGSGSQLTILATTNDGTIIFSSGEAANFLLQGALTNNGVMVFESAGGSSRSTLKPENDDTQYQEGTFCLSEVDFEQIGRLDGHGCWVLDNFSVMKLDRNTFVRSTLKIFLRDLESYVQLYNMGEDIGAITLLLGILSGSKPIRGYNKITWQQYDPDTGIFYLTLDQGYNVLRFSIGTGYDVSGFSIDADYDIKYVGNVPEADIPATCLCPGISSTLTDSTLTDSTLTDSKSLSSLPITTISNTEPTYSYETDLIIGPNEVYDFSNLRELRSSQRIINYGQFLVSAQADGVISAFEIDIESGRADFVGAGDLTVTNTERFRVGENGSWDISASGLVTFLAVGQNYVNGVLNISSLQPAKYTLGYLHNSGLIELRSLGSGSSVYGRNLQNYGDLIYSFGLEGQIEF